MIKKTKAVLLVDTMSFGGSERTVQILANNQGCIENKFIIVSLANVIKYPLNENVERKVIYRKNFHPLIKLLIFPLTLVKLILILKSCQAKTVISFHQQSHMLNVLASKVLKYRSIISERAYIEAYYGKKNIILRPIINNIYNRSNLIVVNDIEIKESLIRYYKIKTKIKVINNLLDVSNFSEVLKKNREDEKIRFITIGRLSKEKNTKDLIYAFKKANIAHSKLDIIGNGPLLESLKLLCKDLDIVDHVIFHGNQTNIGQLLNNADVFVFSSLNEGFPNVILEAMYYELPIISYKFKAGITTILGNGKFGILVPLNDIDKFVKQMKLLAFDKKERIYYQKLSKQRVFCFMNVKQYINKYVSLINLEDGE